MPIFSRYPNGDVTIPPGSATSANQVLQINQETLTNTNLSAISAQLPSSLGIKTSAGSLSVTFASDIAGFPVTQSGTWNINNISGTISLPTGASTAANQATANASLASIDSKIPANLTVNSTLLLVDGSGVTQPISGSVSVSNFPATQPVSGTVAATQSGTWNITNVSGTVSLPTGAATEATLSAQSAKLPATLGQKAMAASLAVTIASDQSAVPASQSGTWNITNVSGTVSLPTGAATSANQTTANSSLSSIDGKLGTLGQKAMTGSAPVVIASDQSAIPISGTVTANNASVSTTGSSVPASATYAGFLGSTGNLTAGKLTAAQNLLVDGSTVTQPISAASLPLPSGAATSALQTTISGQLPATLGQKAMAASLAVTLASDQSALPVSQSGTWNITNVSGTVSLPTGASTAANQTTANSSLSSIDGKIANNYGVSTGAVRTASQIGNTTGAADFAAGNSSAQTLRVVVASNQVSIPTSVGGTAAVTHVRNDYTSVNVTTGAYVQLVASTGSTVNAVEIFDSSGQTLLLATGAAASEVDQIIIFPGGNGRVPLLIASGTRVSIKALSATASVGEIDVNFYA